MREIVSRQFRHAGGFAHVETDEAGHLFMTCSGCKVEEYQAGMAGAILLLTQHVGDDTKPLPD